MDILSFSLGIAVVVVIALAVVAVIAFVKVRKIEKQIEQLESGIFRALQDEISASHRRIDELGSSVFSTLDSRLDKLESKLTDTIKNGCEPVNKLSTKK
jgi:predicted Holliday junction resolvase-like endonuclease